MSVLALFKSMDADPDLHSIVFGESIFNDAIGIVMYETVLKIGTDGDKSIGQEVVGAIIQFTMIFAGSLFIGMCSALLVSFITKKMAVKIKQ